MKKWITSSDLCYRWNINKYDLAEIVSDGKLRQFYADDLSELVIVEGGSIVESPDGNCSCINPSPITGDQVAKLIFPISDVEAFERKNGITPQMVITDPSQKVIVSSVTKGAESSQPEEITDSENFIRSVKVSLVSDTEIKIKVRDKRPSTFEQKELGFKRVNSKIWKAFTDILKKPVHTYHVGKARGAKRARKASYDVSQKRLSGINDKLLLFFKKNFDAPLPDKFKLYELIPEKREAPGTYRFKFEIFDDSEINNENYENLSKHELIYKIENLSYELDKLSSRGDEKSEEIINKIKNELYEAVAIACKKGWLTRNRAEGYLNPSKEYVSQPCQVRKRKRYSNPDNIASEDEDSED